MRELLKQTIDLWLQMRWLKSVEKENRKCRKAYEKYKRHNHVALKLFERYTELYPDTVTKTERSENGKS
jgi:hypothetical protein